MQAGANGVTRSIATCAALALTFLVAAAAAPAQDLDPQFGAGDIVLAPRSSQPAFFTAHPGAIAPADGGGWWWAMEAGDGTIALGRIDASGAPDTSFGGGTGRMTLVDCVGNGTLDLQPATNGRVVLWTGRCLQRRMGNGALDATFATLGSIDVGILSISRLRRDSQARLVLAGSAANTWHAYRFDADGHPDTSFGDAGHVLPLIPSSNGFRGLTSLALRADDTIVLGGWRGNTNGPSLVLFGLTADGAPDPVFGSAGLVDVPHHGGDATVRAHDVVAQPDGSVLVAGERSGSVACCVLFARFSRAGQLDPVVGLRAFPLGNETLGVFFEMRAAIGAAPDGGAWLTRNLFPSSPPGHRTQFTLIRVTASGELDTSFAGRGWRNWSVNEPHSHAPAGDYIQLHDTVFEPGAIQLFGRTFFEDDGSGADYVTFARIRLDTAFADGFE